MENKLIINKSFMSKTSCFKLQLSGKDCYIHTGKKNNDKWEWKKAKFNDDELGQLILFLSAQEKTVSFYHVFEGRKIQIYFNRSEYNGSTVISPVIDKLTGKPLSKGEQVVLKLLLQEIIVRKNLEF